MSLGEGHTALDEQVARKFAGNKSRQPGEEAVGSGHLALMLKESRTKSFAPSCQNQNNNHSWGPHYSNSHEHLMKSRSVQSQPGTHVLGYSFPGSTRPLWA